MDATKVKNDLHLWLEQVLGNTSRYVLLHSKSDIVRAKFYSASNVYTICCRTRPNGSWFMFGTSIPRSPEPGKLTKKPVDLYEGDFELESVRAIFVSVLRMELVTISEEVLREGPDPDLFTSPRYN